MLNNVMTLPKKYIYWKTNGFKCPYSLAELSYLGYKMLYLTMYQNDLWNGKQYNKT